MTLPIHIARLLLERSVRMDTARLHKLLYYVQAWSLARRDEPAFSGPIKAWVNGPVVPSIYGLTKGRYMIGASDIPGDSANVVGDDLEIVESVLDHYGKRSSDFLMALAHFETPWIDARTNATEPSPEISRESMRAYFKGRTPMSIEAEYHLHIASSVERDYADALRLLAQ